MFETLRIQDFRAIRDSGELHLAPLTVIIGANNSGKSSILAALLLLKQSMEDVNPETGLVTSGPLVDVGSYFDILPARTAGRLRIAFTLDRQHAKRVNQGYPFTTEGSTYERPTYERFEFGFGYDAATNNVEVTTASLLDTKTGSVLTLTKEHRHWKLAGLPDRVEQYVKVSTRSFLPSLGVTNSKPPEDLLQTVLDVSLQSHLRSHNLGHVFQDIRYVGPVRDRIPRYATSGATSASELSPSGHNLMRVLAATRRLPDRRKRLIDVLGRWLDARFGLVESLKLRKLDRGGMVRALVGIDRGTRREVNLAAMGSGVSQIVPVVVQTVLTPSGGCLVVEQPEIHLHPAAQATLADLFVENLTHGRQYIIETHSEHLLLRLRRRIADRSVKPESVRVLAVERKDGWTVINQLELSQNGHFKEWPAGFFDEGYQEALALAQAQMTGRNG